MVVKRNLIYIAAALFAIALSFYFYQNTFTKKIKDKSATNTEYVVAENNEYQIIRVNRKTLVKDKATNLAYTPSQNSCEIKIPNDLLEKYDFYNKSVGILELSPYKNIKTFDNQNIFYQHVQNAGCSYTEGTIKIVPNKETNIIECEINVEYKLSGCY